MSVLTDSSRAASEHATGTDSEKTPRGRHVVLGVATAVAVVLAGVTIAWWVDTKGDATVSRNVEVMGVPLSGSNVDEARERLVDLEADLLARPVTLALAEGSLETTLADLGASVDIDATLEESFDVSRSGVFPVRQARWLRSFVSTESVDLQLNVTDPVVTRDAVFALGNEAVAFPAEPEIIGTTDGIDVVAAATGYLVDVDKLVGSVESLNPPATGDIVVPIERTVLEPEVATADAEALAADLESKLTEPLRVTTELGSFNIPAESLTSWIRGTVSDGELVASIDRDLALPAIEELSERLRGEGEPRFEVDGTKVELIAGAAVGCCTDESIDNMLTAALGGETSVTADTSPIGEAGERYLELAGLEIVEEVSTFTTNYAPGQGRVTNIRRMAELTQGAIIAPGEYFSGNEYVGRRTRENGFVSAGVISNGRMSDDVGGGISQWATTVFNAAYYAGLQFDEYQSHSLYISRYPFGREATISFPAPDLKFTNNTPYGILIWPTTTETSITVQFFSTKWVDVVETKQERWANGPGCRRINSHREITNVETGEVINDTTFAVYRNREGYDCNGNPTAQN
jgi:vancomycin resistance protein YoaR